MLYNIEEYLLDHRVFKCPQYLSDADPDDLVRSLKANALKSLSFQLVTHPRKRRQKGHQRIPPMSTLADLLIQALGSRMLAIVRLLPVLMKTFLLLDCTSA
jgi:hypothetical protein